MNFLSVGGELEKNCTAAEQENKEAREALKELETGIGAESAFSQTPPPGTATAGSAADAASV